MDTSSFDFAMFGSGTNAACTGTFAIYAVTISYWCGTILPSYETVYPVGMGNPVMPGFI